MASILDSSYEVPDPLRIADQQQQDVNAGLSNTKNFGAQGAAMGKLFSRAVFGNPEVQQAQGDQDAVKAAQANMAPQRDDESDLQYQIRRTHGVYQAVAPLDANMAQKVADHLVTLQQAQKQQDLLTQQISDDKTRQAGEEQSQLIARKNANWVVGSPDGTKTFGTISLYKPDGSLNTDFDSQKQQLQQDNPGSIFAPQQQWDLNRGQIATQKANAAAALAAVKIQARIASGYTDEGLKSLIGEYAANGPMALRGVGKEGTQGFWDYLGATGLQATDLAAAHNQVKAISMAANSAARRDGNIELLNNSIDGMATNVLTAMQNVKRTDLSAINAAILAGKTQFGDPGEAAYAVAVNGLLNEYSRAMNGGVGQTTDTAKSDAGALLPKTNSKAAMAAAIAQIKDKELPVLKAAGGQALELAANTGKYSALIKVQNALGRPVSAFVQDDSTATTPVAQPTAKDKPIPLKDRLSAILGQ